ncbi:uncharacterized protein LOC143114531 [Alosa pseudoharengus]|uniref:uncharacterized protein LOC143114531 n=1 Tax=Alosa pseudoharengus TaxID=34774 RepID=UPI003F8AF0C9
MKGSEGGNEMDAAVDTTEVLTQPENSNEPFFKSLDTIIEEPSIVHPTTELELGKLIQPLTGSEAATTETLLQETVSELITALDLSSLTSDESQVIEPDSPKSSTRTPEEEAHAEDPSDVGQTDVQSESQPVPVEQDMPQEADVTPQEETKSDAEIHCSEDTVVQDTLHSSAQEELIENKIDPSGVGQTEVQSVSQPEDTAEPEILPEAIDVTPQDEAKGSQQDVVPENECFMPTDESEVTEADSPNLAEGISEEELHAEDSSDVGQTDVQSESQPVPVEQDMPHEADVTPQEEAKSDAEIHCSEELLNSSTVVEDTLDSTAQEKLIENKIDPSGVGQTEVQSVSQPEDTAEPEILPEAIDVTPQDEAKGSQQDVVPENECFMPTDESEVTEADSPNLAEGISEEELHAEDSSDVGQTDVQSESQPVPVEQDMPHEADVTPQEEAKSDAEIHCSEELLNSSTVVEDTLDSTAQKELIENKIDPSGVGQTEVQSDNLDLASQADASKDPEIHPSEGTSVQDASEDTSAQEAQHLSHTKIGTEEESLAPSEKFEVSEDHPITIGVINNELLTNVDDIQESESSDYAVEETTGELITPVTQTKTIVTPSSADFEALQPEDTHNPEEQLKDLRHLDLSIPTGKTETEPIEIASFELGNHEDFTEFKTEEGSVDFEVIPMAEAVSGQLSDFSKVGKGAPIDENDSLNGEGNAEMKSFTPKNECFVPRDKSEVTEADSPNLAEGISEEELHAEDSSDVGQTDVQSESQPVPFEQDMPEEADVTPQEEAKSDAEIHCSEDTVVQDTLDSSAQEELIESMIDNNKLFAPSENPVATEDDHTIAIKEITEEVMGNAEDPQDSESPELEGSYATEETVTQAGNVECEGSTSPGYLNVPPNAENAEIQSLVSTLSEIPQTSRNVPEFTEVRITQDTSPNGLSAEESTQLLIKLQTVCTKILEDLSLFSIQSINVKISARQSPIQLMIDLCLSTNNVAKCENDTSKISKQNDECQKGDEEGQIPV